MSKTKRFKLQPVLDWRKLQADTQQMQVTKLEQKIQQCNELIESLQQSAQQTQQQHWLNPEGSQTDKPFWQNYSLLYVQTLRYKQEALEREKQKLNQQLTQERLKLREARIKEKSLELLAEKQRTVALAAQQRHEEQELNDMGQRRFGSKPWG